VPQPSWKHKLSHILGKKFYFNDCQFMR
jgi:hypothetical protein